VTYNDGQYFVVKGELDMTCNCRPGYEGRTNVYYFNENQFTYLTINTCAINALLILHKNVRRIISILTLMLLGKNVEPFCVKSKYPYCSPDFYNPLAISRNCAPIFSNDQPPQTSCSLNMRCRKFCENDSE